MGIYSTITVSRNAALKILSHKIYSLSNEKLAEVLFTITCNEPPFRNYSITDAPREDGDNELEDLDVIEH